MGYSQSSVSPVSVQALVGSCLPMFLAFTVCLTIVLVTQNKRRMRRRGRWQPTKRFLPVLLCNWIIGLFLNIRGADDHEKKGLSPRSPRYYRKQLSH